MLFKGCVDERETELRPLFWEVHWSSSQYVQSWEKKLVQGKSKKLKSIDVDEEDMMISSSS